MLIFAKIEILAMAIKIDDTFAVYFHSANMSKLFQPTNSSCRVLMKLESIPNLKILNGILRFSGIILGILGTITAVVGKLNFTCKYPQGSMKVIIV